MSVGNTLFLLIAVAGIMTAAGFAHYKRTQAQMRDQVRCVWCWVFVSVCVCVLVGASWLRLPRFGLLCYDKLRRRGQWAPFSYLGLADERCCCFRLFCGVDEPKLGKQMLRVTPQLPKSAMPA